MIIKTKTIAETTTTTNNTTTKTTTTIMIIKKNLNYNKTAYGAFLSCGLNRLPCGKVQLEYSSVCESVVLLYCNAVFKLVVLGLRSAIHGHFQTERVSCCFGKSCLQASNRIPAMDDLAQKGKYMFCGLEGDKLDYGVNCLCLGKRKSCMEKEGLNQQNLRKLQSDYKRKI